MDIFDEKKAQDEVKEHKEQYEKQVIDFFNDREMTEEKKKQLMNMATNVCGEVPDDFTCPICLGIVYEPLTCNQCQNHLYCKQCHKSTQKCPMCKEGSMVDCNKMVRQILGTIQLICNFDSCYLKGQKSISYDELVGKHMEECQSQGM